MPIDPSEENIVERCRFQKCQYEAMSIEAGTNRGIIRENEMDGLGSDASAMIIMKGTGYIVERDSVALSPHSGIVVGTEEFSGEYLGGCENRFRENVFNKIGRENVTCINVETVKLCKNYVHRNNRVLDPKARLTNDRIRD